MVAAARLDSLERRLTQGEQTGGNITAIGGSGAVTQDGATSGPSAAEALAKADGLVDPTARFDDRHPAVHLAARDVETVVADPFRRFEDRPDRAAVELAVTAGEEDAAEHYDWTAIALEVATSSGLALLEGEEIDFALNMELADENAKASNHDFVLLTNKRIVRLLHSPRRKVATFVSLLDLDSAEVKTESKGFAGYVWGALAFLVALMLWWVWENPIGSKVGPAIVALMGAYLIGDQIFAPGTTTASFKTGSSELKIRLRTSDSGETAAFVKRVFDLKGEVADSRA